MNLEALLSACRTERQRKIVKAVAQFGTFSEASRSLGLSISNVHRDFRTIESRAKLATPEAFENPVESQAPDDATRVPENPGASQVYAGKHRIQPLEMPAKPELVVGSLYKAVSVNDVHVPFHNQGAWRLVLHALAFLAPNAFVINGDFMDVWALSRFSKDARRKRSMRDEIEAGNHELDRLDAVLPDGCHKVWLDGNHDQRMDRYINETASDVHDLIDGLRLRNLLKLEERGYLYTPYQENPFACGDFTWQHDTGRHGANAARQSLQDVGMSVAIGHSHRGCTWVEGGVESRPRFAVNGGWLGDWRQIDYRHRNVARREWPLGFTLVYICRETGHTLDARFVPICDESRVVVEGVELRL